MFEIGTPSAQDKPMLVEADGATLELLLTFLHPALSNPSVPNVDSLANLFRLANQYDMQPTIALLRSCLTQPLSSQQDDTLIKREPLASLIVAQSFDLRDATSSALREVIESELGAQMVAASKYDIPVSLMHQINEARLTLSAFLIQIVHVTSTVMTAVKPIDVSQIDEVAQMQTKVTCEILVHPSFEIIRNWHKTLTDKEYFDETRSSAIMKWEDQYIALVAETLGNLEYNSL